MQQQIKYAVICVNPAYLDMSLSMFHVMQHPFKSKALCLCFSDVANLHSVGLVREPFWPLELNFKVAASNTKTLHTKKHQPQGSTLEFLISSFGNTHYDHRTSEICSKNTSYFLFCSNLEI